MSCKVQEEEIVFEFWNSFKGSKTLTKLDPKTGESICWRSHNKLTHDMKIAIKENLKNYTLEEICMAIDNYAEILLGDEYFWTHAWPLSTFLTVKYERAKNGTKKWWRFLSENFDKKVYLKRREDTFKSQDSKTVELPEDPDPELTNMIVERYKSSYNPGGNFPDATAKKHFILVAIKAKKKYQLNSTGQKKNFVNEFFVIAKEQWSDSGETVMPWDLSGTLMWDYKLPQYYQNIGVPEETIGDFTIEKFEDEERQVMREERQVSRKIQQNLANQNPESKSIKHVDDMTMDEIEDDMNL